MILPLRPGEMCWICGRAVRLDTCKTDEHGCAVHERCYLAKIALTKHYHRFGESPSRVHKNRRAISRQAR